MNLTIYAKQHLQLSKSWDHPSHRIPGVTVARAGPGTTIKSAGDGRRLIVTVAPAGNRREADSVGRPLPGTRRSN